MENFFKYKKLNLYTRDKALMVKLSYDMRHAKSQQELFKAVHDFNNSKFNSGLLVEPNLSSRHAAVVSDPINKQLYVAYHGSSSYPEDTEAIKKVMSLKGETAQEIKDSEATLLKAHEANVDNYEMNLVGYSLGGEKINYLSSKYPDIVDNAIYFNPFLSPFKRRTIDDNIHNEVYSVYNDPVTQQSIFEKFNNNTEIHNVYPLESNSGFISAHDLDNFTSTEARSTIGSSLNTGLNRTMAVANILTTLYESYDAMMHNTQNDDRKWENPYQHYASNITGSMNPIGMSGSFGEFGWTDETAPTFVEKLVDNIRSDHSQSEIFATNVYNQQHGNYQDNPDGSITNTKTKERYVEVMGQSMHSTSTNPILHQDNFYQEYVPPTLADTVAGYALSLDATGNE